MSSLSELDELSSDTVSEPEPDPDEELSWSDSEVGSVGGVNTGYWSML